MTGAQRISSEVVYWWVRGVETLPHAARRRLHRRRLLSLMEAELPVPLESVHAEFVRADRQTIVGCAIERRRLADEIGTNATSLTPTAPPAYVPERTPLDRMNLLTGPFEPVRVRRWRRARSLTCIAAGVAVSALLWLGTARRITALNAASAGTREARAQIAGELFPFATSSGTPVQLRLEAELRQLRSAARARSGERAPGNAAVSLARFAAMWPDDDSVRVHDLSATGEYVHATLTLPSMASVESFMASIDSPEGWTVWPQDMQRERDGIRLRLECSIEDGGAS